MLYLNVITQDLRNISTGGMCEGKLQRKNNRPRLCKKVDLEEVEFSVSQCAVLSCPYVL